MVEETKKELTKVDQIFLIWRLTLHMAIRSSSVPFINSSAEFTFLSFGEMSFQMGISQKWDWGNTSIFRFPQDGVYSLLHTFYALTHPKAPSAKL